MATIFKRVMPNGGFTILPNSLFNSNLSLEAIGLVGWLFSKSENWDFSQSGCLTEFKKQKKKIGKTKLKTIVDELAVAGYIEYHPNPKGGWIYYVSYKPEFLNKNPHAENPHAENPHAENPHAENPHLLKERVNEKKDITKYTPLVPQSRENKKEEREENKPLSKSSSQKRGTRLPEDWELPGEGRAFAQSLGIDVEMTFGNFKDYWLSKAGASAVKLDWLATWRMWCRNDAKRNKERRASNFATSAKEHPLEGTVRRMKKKIADGEF